MPVNSSMSMVLVEVCVCNAFLRILFSITSRAGPTASVMNALPYIAVGRRYRWMRALSEENGILWLARAQREEILMELKEVICLSLARSTLPEAQSVMPRHLAENT